jgi:hypothetical protein
VLAHAIRIANRLQKVVRHPDLYSLKDQWIEANQDHLIEGRIARVETRTCWGCHGAGTVSDYWDDEEECGRCDGTGIYSSRTLYEHHFEIVGQRFVFHSYVEPKWCRRSEAKTLIATGGHSRRMSYPARRKASLYH